MRILPILLGVSMAGCLDFGPRYAALDAAADAGADAAPDAAPDARVDMAPVDASADGRAPDAQRDAAAVDAAADLGPLPDMAPDMAPDMTPDMTPADPDRLFATDFSEPTIAQAFTQLAPERFTLADFGTRIPGRLTLRPALGGWHLAQAGGLIFVEITGDFRAETDVDLTRIGVAAPPEGAFNVAGILARAPAPEGSPENWAMSARGRHFELGLEAKTTRNSTTDALRRSPGSVRGRLRLCRLGDDVHLLHHDPDAGWQSALDVAFVVRPDLPATLQVGLFAGAWNSDTDQPGEGPVDLEATFDHFEVRRIRALADCTAE